MIDEPKHQILPKHLTGKRYFTESQSLIIDRNPYQHNLGEFWDHEESREQDRMMNIEDVLKENSF